ncbi:unnamed protein product [Heligmosomoides polygyrus]|uniref:FLZ-type domain-containing protein n=1 Tax=Heligmosomoides polygyrus TaxID=6339 RepID=A0A183FUE2_HELPZ|nr:unnamed protein product [Heligmosomoides polygyrus]
MIGGGKKRLRGRPFVYRPRRRRGRRPLVTVVAFCDYCQHDVQLDVKFYHLASRYLPTMHHASLDMMSARIVVTIPLRRRFLIRLIHCLVESVHFV